MRAETHKIKIGILVSNRRYGQTRKKRNQNGFESIPDVERDHYNGRLLLESLGFEQIIEVFDASHERLTDIFQQLKANEDIAGGKKVLIFFIYSGHGVILQDNMTQIVTNSAVAQKLYFPIEKTLKIDIAKAFSNVYVLGILDCGRALPVSGQGQAFKAAGDGIDDESLELAKNERNASIRDKIPSVYSTENGFGNFILTFPVKSGSRKPDCDNRLIPWYYQLFKTAVRLRRGDYMVLPIPRFILSNPPPNKGEHIAKGTERLRIYLPKRHSLPGFVLQTLPLTCSHLER